MIDATFLQPHYWRQRAQEAREAAKEVYPGNRQELEDVAAAYEEMADLMEKHARAGGRQFDAPPAPANPKGSRRKRGAPLARPASSAQR